jgi:hypothetical protein
VVSAADPTANDIHLQYLRAVYGIGVRQPTVLKMWKPDV